MAPKVKRKLGRN